ncbi:hypothetical protein CBL_05141 [Carabus blaptoides fortunei]
MEIINKYKKGNVSLEQAAQVIDKLKQIRDLKDDQSYIETSSSSTYSASVISERNMDLDLDENLVHQESHTHPTNTGNQTTTQNSEEFQLVPHNKRRKTSLDQSTHVVTISNRFNALNSSAHANTEASENTKTSDTANKQRTPPPVFLKSTQQWLILAAAIKSEKINIKSTRANPDAIRIQPAAPVDYVNLNKLLDTMKLEYFTFRLPHEKPIQVVIRGLYAQAAPDAIKTELLELGHPVLSVYRIKETTLMTVNLRRCEEAKRIYDVNRLNYLTVKVKAKRRNNDPKQCRNCQRCNRTAGGCHMHHRCVKCLFPHGPGKCLKIDKTIHQAESVNCRGNHTANYRGCTNYSAAKKSRPKKTPTTRPGVSYAKALSDEATAPPRTRSRKN